MTNPVQNAVAVYGRLLRFLLNGAWLMDSNDTYEELFIERARSVEMEFNLKIKRSSTKWDSRPASLCGM